MMYEKLAQFYDALVKDEEATKAWVDLIETYLPKGKIMELACGSGEITIALAKDGYEVHASDLSADMIQQAKAKQNSELVEWKVMDMCNFTDEDMYDGILCLCDSFNYVLKEKDVEKLLHGVYEHLKEEGIFIVDMHSMDRLEEFKEEYNEAGRINGHEYQWTIQTIEDCIYQNFAFYDEDGRNVLEQHIQKVYKPEWVLEKLEKIGFQVEVFTDFIYPGICAGEKQFYICRKGAKV